MIEVQDVPARNRFVILVDGAEAGFAAYARIDGRLVFDHTRIQDAYAGQGLGGILLRRSMDQVRAQGVRVVPICEFLAGWLDKHPDYQDLVDEEMLERLLSSR